MAQSQQCSNSFKLTRTASSVAVTAALSAALFGMPLTLHSAPQQAGQDHYQAVAKAAAPLAVAQRKLAQQPTASGHQSHFDNTLERATFVWGQAKAAPATAQVTDLKARAHTHMQRLSGISALKSSQVDVRLNDWHDIGTGAIVARYQQFVQGIEVFNRRYSVMLNRQGSLVAGAGYFADVPQSAQNFTALGAFSSEQEAALRAIAELSDVPVQLDARRIRQGYNHFEVRSASDQQQFDNVRVKAVFYPLADELKAAHYVEVERKRSDSLESDYFAYVIASDTGKVLFKNNLHSHATEYNYRVYADVQSGYPLEGPHGDVIPADGPNQTDETTILAAPLVNIAYYSAISTQDPWLGESATRTEGNNVFAYADINAPQGFTSGDVSAETTSAFTFDYPIDPELAPTAEGNVKAAVVNLFYMNNFLHDFFYDYGFDETAGVAQQDNYGRGGAAGDPIEAQAQDYSGLNNANMATPADGASPRMQMYLYNSKDAQVGQDFGVIGPTGIGTLSSSQRSAFGPLEFDITGELARFNDGNDVDSGSVFDGCEAAADPSTLANKIAIIERGSCNFTVKVKNAQDADALGAIVTNNVDDGTPAPMGGEDATVTIGNMGLSFDDGQQLYNAMLLGSVTVRMFNTNPLKDGTFDNGIIAHEWGHYISNRLIGNGSGLGNFQGRAMGEGWADFHSLLFIAKASDAQIAGNSDFTKPYATGTFVEDFYFGIRRVPYTPNQDINPLNFRHITEGAGGDVGLPPTSVASPHAPGELWASVLWDSYVALINEHGFSEAQQRMARYLVAGYKMTPVSPLYTEARDALLAAIAAEDVDDYRLALNAFANRGMGLGAQSPERFSTTLDGVVESYETQASAFSAEQITLDPEGVSFCSADGYLDIGETGTLTVQISNTGSETLNNIPVQFSVLSQQDVTLGNGGESEVVSIEPFASAQSTPINVSLNDADIASPLQLQVSFPDDGESVQRPEPITQTFTVNIAFADAPLTDASQSDDMELAALSKENLALSLLKDTVGSEQTLSFDNSDIIDTFEQGGVQLGEQSLFLRNNSFESDVALTTRAFTVAEEQDFSVSFWHFYALEEFWDGAVVEVNINDQGWQDVTEAGGQFAVGYNGQLNQNPAQSLQQRPVFTGRNSTDSVFGNMETIDFGQQLAGEQVQLRFRISSDGSVEDTGWWIDNVSIAGISSEVFYQVVPGDVEGCDNRPPVIAQIPAQSVDEGEQVSISADAQDADGDTLSYQWQQTAGPDVTLSAANTATVSFNAPQVSAQETLEFTVTVSDGELIAQQDAQVSVNNIAEPAPEPEPQPTPSDSDEGGSGSMGGWALLLLAMLGLRRQK